MIRTAMTRLIDDLGPDFDRRWKRAALATRRAVVAELRDLYLMLEQRDHALLARLRNGSIPAPRDPDDGLPLLRPPGPPPLQQGSLFVDAGPAESPADSATPPVPTPAPARENPFLPRSVLERLQENRNRAGAALPGEAALSVPLPLANSHEQSDLERELRLKLGPVVENLIDMQMDGLRSELRLRLRLEMDRLIAEHLRK